MFVSLHSLSQKWKEVDIVFPQHIHHTRVPLAYSSHMYISTLWVLIVEPLNDQLPVGLLADSGKGSKPFSHHYCGPQETCCKSKSCCKWNKVAANFQNELLQIKTTFMRAHWRKEECVLRFLYFEREAVILFSWPVWLLIRTNFLKCFAVRADWNALQPQISFINVVSQEPITLGQQLSHFSNEAASSVDKDKPLHKEVFPSGISLRNIDYGHKWLR